MIQFNEKLFQNIQEKDRWIGELLLFLIYRGHDPIELLSRFDDNNFMEGMNRCLTVFTNYSIIELNQEKGGFLLKRPLFSSEAIAQKRNTKDIRKFFYKTYCEEDNRNTADYIVQLVLDKFFEKHDYKWDDVVKVTEKFMSQMMLKPKGDRYIPKLENFITDPKYLLTLLEELDVSEEIELAKKGSAQGEFDFNNNEFHL
jgi:hypothetical protein